MTAIDPSIVAEFSLFRELSRDQIRDILSSATPRRYAKNTNVFEQDGKADYFFLLLNGHLRVSRLIPDGQQVVVRYIVAGDIFGIAMAIGRDTYPATATAIVESLALAWPSASWPSLVAKYPTLAAGTMQTLGNRLQDVQARVVEMSTEEVERRVAHALLRLVRQSGRKVEQGIEIDFPISRQDVAEMTGTTLHTVSRILSAWEDRGLVRGGRQKIILTDAHRLFLLAEGQSES
ncbi:Crp/Fnr family transcriptional regulator [uncultured Ferrovibrio sp.]|jgi:transcriptional regulator, Crp/Fnr family|uniref:Crp/Fnr family transcriptional regulator n=1 Tax=uncultured Ferrovibrio sp. TaxID=1576913 RepID=UPI00262BE971|nr:Crp/Fnr family transcriptional regulator [uncultured Ferrovibrio sp.]